MRMLRLALVLSMGIAGVVGAEEKDPKVAGGGSARGHIMLTAKDLKWGDAPPGLPKGQRSAVLEGDLKEGPFTLRAELPANYRIMPHMHPTLEHVTVLSGSVNMGMGEKLDEKASTKLEAGAFVAMPANKPHYLWTTEKAVIQAHGIGPFQITYVDSKDDPRNAATAPAVTK